MIVVDSNVIAHRHLSSGQTTLAERVERKDSLWIMPRLWRYEFQNILATSIKAAQLSVPAALAQWSRVVQAMAGNEVEASPGVVLELVDRHRITAYDAQFIALALERSVTCVTEDRELRSKFPGLAVSMEEFLRPPPATVREPRAKQRYAARSRRSAT